MARPRPPRTSSRVVGDLTLEVVQRRQFGRAVDAQQSVATGALESGVFERETERFDELPRRVSAGPVARRPIAVLVEFDAELTQQVDTVGRVGQPRQLPWRRSPPGRR